MKKHLFSGLVLFGLIGLIGYTVYAHFGNQAEEARAVREDSAVNIRTGNKVGERAPYIELSDVDGHLIQLADYRGKQVLVNFWATWCPPCREEMPDMQRFYDDYGDRVIVLGVNVTTAEADVGTVQSFVDDRQLTFPIVLDEDGHASDAYRIIAIPTTFALDEDGVIREVFFGAVDYETMKQTIDNM